ncbi:MFS transporter [Pseudonocardia nematodicida]|uniref:MFS transporter n=1 Tax=Pseudonocardia nematodicida TaxID=1206997 RepID=A0ABV1KCE8_9PSEU
MPRFPAGRVPAPDALPRLSRAVAVGTFGVLAIAYGLHGMGRQVFPVLLPGIRADLGFGLGAGGFLATVSTLGVGLAGIPAGYLLARLSRRAVMAVGILVFAGCTVLTAVATGVGDMAVYRALSGVGEALQNVALFAAVGAYFAAHRALALGGLTVAYGIGSFLGPVLGVQLAGALGGWTAPFWVYGMLGLVLVVVVATFVSRRFTEQPEPTSDELPEETVAHVPASLYNRNLVLISITAAIVGVATYGYIALYPTFLQEQLGFGPAATASAAGVFGLGALVALPAGRLADRWDPRVVVAVALVAGAGVGRLLFHGPRDLGGQLGLSFAEGAVAGGVLFVTLHAAMQRAVRPPMAGRASGVFIAAFHVPAAFAGYLFGALVTAAGWAGAALWQLTVLPLAGAAVVLLVDVRRFADAGPAGPAGAE